jgi:hypothetical protein
MDIWRSEKANKIRKAMVDCKEKCAVIRCYYSDTFLEKIRKFRYFIWYNVKRK